MFSMMMQIPTLALLAITLLGVTTSVQAVENSQPPREAPPLILGKGVGLFEVGELLAKDDFEDLRKWVVQVEQRDGFDKAHVEARDRKLDCFVPGRGCTIWFKDKLATRVAITYEVICPTPAPSIRGIEPKDINNFWMASDPLDAEAGLFDSARYTGEFDSYHKMDAYYASTGGGRNTTTRMRRYPREIDGNPVDHLALTHRDGDPEFLITPDKIMRVQLVAYDEVIQYIVDGKLVYEISTGDPVDVEGRDAAGKRVTRDTLYDKERFPIHKEGYFGFRMVGTHHVYSKFRVNALRPARKKVEVASIAELRKISGGSDQHVVMKPGHYVLRGLVNERVGIELSGSNNHFDLTGVTIQTPISIYRVSKEDLSREKGIRGFGTLRITGNHVSLDGGTFESTYAEPKGPIRDFGSYNQNPDHYPEGNVTEIRLSGDDIKLTNCRLTVRGSYPYGYGNMYGIGDDPAVTLRKHCGILITGDRVLIDGCWVKMEAFGHAIFVQGGDQITVRNSEVEGEVRPSNDFYRETNDGDLGKRFDYKIQWPEQMKGIAVPRDHMINLMEDGIRAYKGTGHMTVENCKVTKARGGIKLYMAKSATVSDCEVIDCVIQGYSLPSRGTITRSRGNAAYGPLLYVHMDSHVSQKIDLEVVSAPHALGDHPLAAIKGQGHQITLRAKESIPENQRRPIIIGYYKRFDYLCVDFPSVPAGMEEHFKKFAPESFRASGIELTNETDHPVVFGDLSQENQVISRCKVTDYGKGNQQVTPESSGE